MVKRGVQDMEAPESRFLEWPAATRAKSHERSRKN